MLNWTHLWCCHQNSPFPLNTPQCFHNCDVLIATIEQVINILVLMYKTWFPVVCQWSRRLAPPMQHPSKTAWSLHSSWVPSISQHHPGWIQSLITHHTRDEMSTLKEEMQCSWPPGSDSDLCTQATNPAECKQEMRRGRGTPGSPGWTGGSLSPELQASWVHLAHTSQCPRSQPSKKFKANAG